MITSGSILVKCICGFEGTANDCQEVPESGAPICPKCGIEDCGYHEDIKKTPE